MVTGIVVISCQWLLLLLLLLFHVSGYAPGTPTAGARGAVVIRGQHGRPPVPSRGAEVAGRGEDADVGACGAAGAGERKRGKGEG